MGQYGRFQTRMQGSDRKGTIATFMTLFLGDENERLSTETWNHINLELVPHAFEKVTTNLIWKNFTNEWDKVKNFDPSNNWHEYDIMWTPEHITFTIDGVERRREIHTDTNFNEALADINKKHHIIMNFWTPDWCADQKTSMVLALIQIDGQPPLIALEVARLPLCLRTLISRKASSFLRWRIYMLNQVMTTNLISRRSRKSPKSPTKSMVIQIGRFFLPLRKAA